MMSILEIGIAMFHGGLTLFNLLGWIPRRTRRAHLIVILATLASWSILGIFYGLGYCPFTDWQWDLKRRQGATDLPNSFVEYYLERLTGADLAPATVDAWVLGCAIVAFTLSLWLNLRDVRRERTERYGDGE